MAKYCSLLYVVLTLLVVSRVHAQDGTVVVGAPLPSPTGTFENVNLPFAFHFLGRAGRSYCCTTLANNDVANITAVSSDFTIGGSAMPLSYKSRGSLSPIVSVPGGFNPAPAARACLIIPENVSSIKMTVESGLGNPTFTNLLVSCEETTLIGGFNTAAGEFNFLEVTKTEGDEISISVRAASETSSDVPSFGFRETMNSPRPIQRRDFDIHSLAGSSSFGGMTIAHDGTPASIKATLSQYKSNTPQPGDFLKVGSVPFERLR